MMPLLGFRVKPSGNRTVPPTAKMTGEPPMGESRGITGFIDLLASKTTTFLELRWAWSSVRLSSGIAARWGSRHGKGGVGWGRGLTIQPTLARDRPP